MPRNAVFSMVYGLLAKMQRHRILSENGVVWGKNGVVNGVVKLDGDVKYRNKKWMRPMCLPGGGCMGFSKV